MEPLNHITKYESTFVKSFCEFYIFNAILTIHIFILGQLRTLAVLDTETKDHYWLTVCAQDQGVVPLHSCVKVSKNPQHERIIQSTTQRSPPLIQN